MTDLSRLQTKSGKVFRHGKEIEVEIIQSITKPKRKDHLFAQVPLQWAAAAAKATDNYKAFVWTWLWYEAWRIKSLTFSVSNVALAKYGIDRKSKYRALKSLEAAGLISIVRHKKKALVVTMIHVPIDPLQVT